MLQHIPAATSGVVICHKNCIDQDVRQTDTEDFSIEKKMEVSKKFDWAN